jgi:hypothetical protein
MRMGGLVRFYVSRSTARTNFDVTTCLLCFGSITGLQLVNTGFFDFLASFQLKPVLSGLSPRAPGLTSACSLNKLSFESSAGIPSLEFSIDARCQHEMSVFQIWSVSCQHRQQSRG